MRARLAVLVGLAAWTAGSTARADNPHLVAAREHKRALDYQAARRALEQAYRAGGNDPAELAEIFRLSGEVEAGLGDAAAAAWGFERLLALVPDAELPPGTSPKLAAPFALARERAAGRPPLTVRHRLAPGGIEVVIEADRLALVAGAAARYRRASDRRPVVVEASGRGSIGLPLPPERLELEVWVFDRHRNRLAVLGSETDPLVVTVRAETPPASPRAPALYARWMPWAGVAVAAAAAATWFGLEVREAERELEALHESSADHDYAEADAIARRGRRDAWIANLGLAAAGAAAVTSVVLWLRDPRRRAGRRRAAPALVIGPLVSADGGAGGWVAIGF